MVTFGGLALAAFALVLAAAYQANQDTTEPTIIGGLPATTGSTGVGQTAARAGPVDPVEAFLPRSGQGSACLEPVGVDLIPGYAATLTINGIPIPPEQMNVALDADGKPTNQITASRSLGQYTFGPEAGCPDARVLRPTNNLLQACIYRIQDGPASCVIKQNTFDVL